MSTINRRGFLKRSAWGTACLLGGTAGSVTRMFADDDPAAKRRPNILFAIADDWSWPHASAYGDPGVRTPAFDRVAREGCLFTNAFASAPQCSPNRAVTLTGRNIWQLEEAGTHFSIFPKKFEVFPDVLETAGYFVGFTGKPWSPGSWEKGGRDRNPAGPEFGERKVDSFPAEGLWDFDYAGNFDDFLSQKPDDKPFLFWYGCYEPHRRYEQGIGLKSGKRLEDAVVPPFLPDVELVRSDILDYYYEVEWFDRHLEQMLRRLEEAGELDNTLVVVTSDNGMPFPRAKANLYEYGTHVPLAIRWPAQVEAGRVVEDLIGFADFAPTFFEAAGLRPLAGMTGRSFMDALTAHNSGRVDRTRQWVLTGRERHTHSRYDNLGYPARAIRTYDFLYIRNLKPERWPLGDPEGFHDIDESPTKTLLKERRSDEGYQEWFEMAFGKRPLEELYDVRNDPGCIVDLARKPEFAEVRIKLARELEKQLTAQGDPRMLGHGDIFESYPRFGGMRPQLGGFAERGEYNPKYQK